MNAADLVAEYESELRNEGRALGRREGRLDRDRELAPQLRSVLIAEYMRRYGALPETVRYAIEATGDAAQLTAWLGLVVRERADALPEQFEYVLGA